MVAITGLTACSSSSRIRSSRASSSSSRRLCSTSALTKRPAALIAMIVGANDGTSAVPIKRTTVGRFCPVASVTLPKVRGWSHSEPLSSVLMMLLHQSWSSSIGRRLLSNVTADGLPFASTVELPTSPGQLHATSDCSPKFTHLCAYGKE